jgi:hypothetical protein
MDTGIVKDTILLLLLEHQEKNSQRMWLDAKSIGDAIGIPMTVAATLLGSDLVNAGLVRPVPVPNEPPSWAGYYALTEQGMSVAQRLKETPSDT